jgi:predicted Zn-dependent protease
LPGGFLYLNLGLLKAVETEEELAGIIAHLVAHVAARHSVEVASKGQLINWSQAPLQAAILREKPDPVKPNTPLVFPQIRRRLEAEADALGVQYAWAAGYDPNGLTSFLERIEKEEKVVSGQIAKIFRSHPPASERRAKVKELIARFPDRAEEFNRIKARLLQLK